MALTAAVAGELRAAVARRNITQKDLSERADVPLATLGKILRGVSAIDVEQLHRICEALGADIVEIVDAAEREIAPVAPAPVIEGRFGGARRAYPLDAAALERPTSHHDEDVAFEEQP